ncbi:hypothetical protein MMC34_002837 [Xylographa carneopallida]|nr:hypothetical protein [Xylographa carneopallida]
MEIHLQDSRSAKWSVKGKPQKSVAVDRVRSYQPRDSVIDRSNEQADLDEEDYLIALAVFERLYTVTTVQLNFPDDIKCDINSKRNLTHSRDTPADDLYNDRITLEDRDQMFMDLDLELDVLPGFTARMLRLERFSSWYTNALGSESKYERQLERILRTRSTDYHNYKELQQIRLWYVAMRAFNPTSLYYRYNLGRLRDNSKISCNSRSDRPRLNQGRI